MKRCNLIALISIGLLLILPLTIAIAQEETDEPDIVTTPEEDTVATRFFEDVHETAAPGTACPFRSLTVAVRRLVAPTWRLNDPGETSNRFRLWLTRTVMVSAAAPFSATVTVTPFPSGPESKSPMATSLAPGKLRSVAHWKVWVVKPSESSLRLKVKMKSLQW